MRTPSKYTFTIYNRTDRSVIAVYKQAASTLKHVAQLSGPITVQIHYQHDEYNYGVSEIGWALNVETRDNYLEDRKTHLAHYMAVAVARGEDGNL